MTPLRTLPLSIAPIDGETTDGYLRRLAAVHYTTVAEVRHAVLASIGRATWNTFDPRVGAAIARLADIPAASLEPSFEEHGVWVRCGHDGRWRPRQCERCRRFTNPRRACSACAEGLATETVARGGGYCARHRQWATDAHEFAVDDTWGYGKAEAIVSDRLWPRGVSLSTGELQLSAALCRTAIGEDPAVQVRRRSRAAGRPEPRTYVDFLAFAYPEVVAITDLITTRAFVSRLLDPSASVIIKGKQLSAAVAKLLSAPDNDELRELSIRIVGHAHEAVVYAEGLRRTRQAKQVLCPPARALIVAANRRRACLLRHASPRVLRNRARPRSDGTPPPSVTRNEPLVPDVLALR